MLVSSPLTSTTLFSSRVGNVCYFVTPEGVHSSTLLSLPGSLSPVHPMPATSMSLYKSLNQKPYDDGHLYAALIRSAAGGCPELPPWIHSPHSRPTTASRQKRERCPPLCVEYSQLCSLHSSCQQVFHFQWPVANHLGETFILNQISKRKRWLKYPRVKMQTEKECDVLIVLLYGTYRGVIGQDVIIFIDKYLQTFLCTFTNFEGL